MTTSSNDHDFIANTLKQLNAARKLVLQDSSIALQVVQGVLPIVGPSAGLELRRWGADFIAETLASPRLPRRQKQELSLVVLETLQQMAQTPAQDAGVLKSVIQASASVYPLVIGYLLDNTNESAIWGRMASIKSSILRMWSDAAIGTRVACIKFVQNVVMVQTTGAIPDPRNLESYDLSLALVPRDHPLIPSPNLEAEASGLLDRMLDVFDNEQSSNALLVDATLNSLAPLIRNRPLIAHKIVNRVLNFNPLRQASHGMTSKARVIARSMERTTRALLVNISKQNPHHPLTGRIQHYIERLAQTKAEVFEESNNRKRGAPTDHSGAQEQAKRARLEETSATPSSRIRIPPLPQGSPSVAQLFTLTKDESLTSFDVQQLPIEMVVNILLPVIFKIDQPLLNDAINGIRARWLSLQKSVNPLPAEVASGVTGVDDEDDDYDPDFMHAEDTEQILNKLDSVPPSGFKNEVDAGLGTFDVPQPALISGIEAIEYGEIVTGRLFLRVQSSGPSVLSKAPTIGLNRLAGTNHEGEIWRTALGRIATRSGGGRVDGPANFIKKEEQNQAAMVKGRSLSNNIREYFFAYVLEDFRTRLVDGISWLTEEYYNDRVQENEGQPSPRNYEYWVSKVLTGILSYIDTRDRNFLIRFFSEIPKIDESLLDKIKVLARNPELVDLVVKALHYLVLLRPPAHEMALDALEDLWRNYDGARNSVGKLLQKYRPTLFNDSLLNGPTHTTSDLAMAS